MVMISPVAKTGRSYHTPEHQFFVEAKPYVIQPMLIHPVLPGMTLTNMLWQARSQTENIVSQFQGWHLEFYFFYVKLSQLDSAASWIAPGTGMLMNPEFDPTSLANTAMASTYHEDTSSINYVKRCRDVVVREYFRDHGDDETDGLIDTTEPLAMYKKPGWMDSIALTSELVAASPDLPDDAANATIRELQRLEMQWEMLNTMGITDMTYEDFLATFGMAKANVSSKKPEIIRWAKYWQLPATAVDGATGATSTVVSWKVEGRADKDRLFREHGFICGYVVTRPKAFFQTQRTAAVSMLNSAFAWAPKMFDQAYNGITIRDLADGEGPLASAVSEGHTVDTKDLFMYGDQFVNAANAAAATSPPNFVWSTSHVPTSKFPITGAIDGLFVSANTTNLVRHDGVVTMGIKMAMKDTTPQSGGRVVLPI